ncbi:MAG: bacillithiol biosynthesis cysteine-adding enzyme BshC [Weeksellaceae bacterium]|nr:bacillithiol biosynthesis cysteine-adding enzyme BshC [Weeksellaceae bacterium]
MKPGQSIHWDAKQFGKLSPLMQDYLNRKPITEQFFVRFPNEKSLIEQTRVKLKSYKNREILCETLKRQLSFLELSEIQKENIEKLKLQNTVTITTGHQLNLFTGPVYFFYKTLQVIQCCKLMNQKYSEYNFVPIFWMATEDHDFEEINHFYFKGKTYHWDRGTQGAVGRLNLEGIEQVFENFCKSLPASERADELKKLFEEAYLKSNTLTEATQRLIQKLFSDFGLLMVDGDDKALKKLMIPTFEEDLLKNTAFHKISETNSKLIENGYKTTAHAREINLFYLGDGSIRERIVLENEQYKVLNSNFVFSREEIIRELNERTDRFSPNVIMRPLYQETILPNIAYIGGAGESAYWLQLKDFFEAMKIDYPLVIVRNSVLILTHRQRKKLEKLSIDYSELFRPLHEIINRNVLMNTETEIGFQEYENQLNNIFEEIAKEAVKTDVTFSKMVAAQHKKQMKGMHQLIKRLGRAERRRQAERVKKIETLYDELFPQNTLQERIVNFSEFYLEHGKDFIEKLVDEIKPIDFCFTIRTFDN